MRVGTLLKSMQKAECPGRATADYKEKHQFRVVPPLSAFIRRPL